MSKYEKIFTVILGVNFLICIIINIMRIFFFPAPQIILWLFLAPCFFIELIIYCIIFRKRLLKNAVNIITVIVCVLAIAFSYILHQAQFDSVKYEIYKDSYKESAAIIEEDLKNAENTCGFEIYNQENLTGLPRSCREIRYIKDGKNLLIDFRVSESLFNQSGFTYYNSEEILDFFENPKKYNENYSEKACDKYTPMKEDNWLYIWWC